MIYQYLRLTAIFLGLSLILMACQNNQRADMVDNPKYVYPAETVPVTPEKTKTRQDNTELDKEHLRSPLDSSFVQQDEDELKLVPSEEFK